MRRVVLLLAVVALPARAQSARAVRPPSAMSARATAAETLREVDALVARNDSLGALALLDSAIAHDRKSGPLWHRYGRIAWGMSKTEKGPVMRPSMIRLRMRADSAMRYATAFAPDSARFWLDLGSYALETDNVFVRKSAKGQFDDGLKVARESGNKALASMLTDQLAMFEWREFDNVNFRALEKSDESLDATVKPSNRPANGFAPKLGAENSSVVNVVSASESRVGRDQWLRFYAERLSRVTPPTGEGPFVNALRGFRDAVELDPTNQSALSHVFGALADHQSWQDLRQDARVALRRDGENIAAWLASGLANTMLEHHDSAAADFANALRRMGPGERRAFTNIKRLLAPSRMDSKARYADSVRWDSLPAAERTRQETMFWNLADPRQSTRVNEALVEFYARVAYADFRFGSDEYRQRGADTDRGDTWVRYGPPDSVYSLPRLGYNEFIWLYGRQQLAFVFNTRPTFGTFYFLPADRDAVDSIHAAKPSGWDNMPLVKRTWPMRMRIARFRSSADSMDAVITSTIPVRSFLEGAELAGQLPIAVHLDVHDPRARIVGREIRKVNVTRDSLPIGINGTWVRRLGRGANVVRIDAEQADVQRAASAATDAQIDTTSGFGLSDLLLGTNPKPANGSGFPARWSDISIAPTTGVFPWSQSLGVVWESYDLTPKDGNARYIVHLHLARTFTNNVRGLVARIGAYGKNLIERDGSGTGSVSVDYEQVRPGAPIITDFLNINLNGSVPGTYRLTIEIEDVVAKRSTKRSADFVLTKD